MSGRELDEAAWEAAAAEFGEGQAVWLTVAIGTINAWNRIAGGLRFAPPVVRRKEQAA
jgi:alkylhydroperoxidase family enzyme